MKKAAQKAKEERKDMAASLRSLVDALDERILTDGTLGPEVFNELIAAQRDLGLLHGDRPTCPFLRPHIVTRSQYAEIQTAASTIATAFEKTVEHALQNSDLLAVLGLTETEARMARIDPGYRRLCVTSRLDAYLSDEGFKFLEYNAESPAGIGDQMQLEKVLFRLPQTKNFLDANRHWRPAPHEHLLRVLAETYREWGGEEDIPQIAIVDWAGVATASEFRVLQEYFKSVGHPTIIADPQELEYRGGKLSVGDFRIDVLYKRVVIHEFLDRTDETHALARAYADRKVCMVNSFRSKVAHKKAGFAVLSDPRFADLFTATERQTFARHIPWTRRVLRGRTTFEGGEQDLLQLIRRERQRLVLKPNDDYGGHGVFLGWEMDEGGWDAAIESALQRPYVVQERVPTTRLSIPRFTDRAFAENMSVDFNPFLFNNEVEGALVRLSSSSLLNVTSGGGQTALLILEDL
jgi:uncharacterized circularly permuted ATP-grasp superfamily protein